MLDSNPINSGHTLVIPKKHDNYIFDLNDREYSELMLKAKTVAKTLKEKLLIDAPTTTLQCVIVGSES